MSVTPPSLDLLPDAERLVAAFLREHSRIAALVGDRVYTVYPAKAGNAPLLLVQLVGSDVPFSQPLVIEHAQMQFAAYGGPKLAAWELAATTRAVLTELEGAVRTEGNVAGVAIGSMQWLPDEAFSPPRPRYLFDTTITMRPAAASPGVGERQSRRQSPDDDQRRRVPVGVSTPGHEEVA